LGPRLITLATADYLPLATRLEREARGQGEELLVYRPEPGENPFHAKVRVIAETLAAGPGGVLWLDADCRLLGPVPDLSSLPPDRVSLPVLGGMASTFAVFVPPGSAPALGAWLSALPPCHFDGEAFHRAGIPAQPLPPAWYGDVAHPATCRRSAPDRWLLHLRLGGRLGWHRRPGDPIGNHHQPDASRAANTPIPKPLRAEPEVEARRRDICAACERHGTGGCTVAGCRCSGLGRPERRYGRCPLGRWPEDGVRLAAGDLRSEVGDLSASGQSHQPPAASPERSAL
jgi:hypothetical protein